MSKRHQGKTAVISGAASGIGQASAVRLAEEGAQIVIADRAKADDTLQAVKAAGGSAVAVQCDISDPASVAKLRDEVDKNGGRCDILVNNAGIYPMQSFDQITFEDWRRVLSVNLDSMFLMAKAFAGAMRQRGWGRIINLASDTVNLLVPDFVHYITSKAGVVGFTRSLATELGPQGDHRQCHCAGIDAHAGHACPQGRRRHVQRGAVRDDLEYAVDQALRAGHGSGRRRVVSCQ